MSEEITPAEANAVARLMAENYRNYVNYYRQQGKSSREEALQRADEMRDCLPAAKQRIEDIAPCDLDWFDFEQLENLEEGGGLVLWEKVKQAAREELETGLRGAEGVINRHSRPLERARYLVLREGLARTWKPANGIEALLIDQLAQAYSAYQHWMQIVGWRAGYEARRIGKEEARWELPRLSETEAQDHAAAMADRFHRLFQRTLRSLRDLRRYSPQVIVQNAGQVNVGAQQINVAQSGQEAQDTVPEKRADRSASAKEQGDRQNSLSRER